MDGDAQRIRVEMQRSPVGDLVMEGVADISAEPGELCRVGRIGVIAVTVDMDCTVSAGQRYAVLVDEFALEAAKQQFPLAELSFSRRLP